MVESIQDSSAAQAEPAAGEQQMEEVEFEMLPINVEPGQTHEMTEYEKRMKRAARFGIDPTAVAGPQAATTANITSTEDDMDMEID